MSKKKYSESHFAIIGIATTDAKREPSYVPSDGYSSKDTFSHTGDSGRDATPTPTTSSWDSSRDVTPTPTTSWDSSMDATPVPTSGDSSRGATPTPENDSKKSHSKKKIKTFDQVSIDYDTINIDERIIKNFKEKYYVTLKFVNNILTNSNLEKITELTNFIDVDRQLIIAQKNEDMLSSMLSEIYHYFGKRECQYGQKDKTKHYIVTILKNMCKQLTLSLNKKSKNIQREGFVKSYILYTISNS